MTEIPLNFFIISPLPGISHFSTKYFILSNVTDEGGIKWSYHGLSACVGDNPLARACKVSARIGGQTRGITITCT